VITCVVDYVIDPAKITDFEQFATRWIELVEQHGGTHHGYFLPAEGASDRALALFSFPSLAAYEQYRSRFGSDPEFVEADRIRDDSGCATTAPSCAPSCPNRPTAKTDPTTSRTQNDLPGTARLAHLGSDRPTKMLNTPPKTARSGPNLRPRARHRQVTP
jgi:hypothetical protein